MSDIPFCVSAHGRRTLRDATVRSLHIASYDGSSDLVVEPRQRRGEKIVEKGYSIVLNMGDRAGDLPGEYAERTFKFAESFVCHPVNS